MLTRRQEQTVRALYRLALSKPIVGVDSNDLIELIHLVYGASRRPGEEHRHLATRVKEAEERLEQLGLGLDELANDPALPLFYRGGKGGKVRRRKRVYLSSAERGPTRTL